jgi:hypothetical protein
MGFAPLDRLDATPNPIKTFLKRPSQSNAMSYVESRRVWRVQTRTKKTIEELTLDVDARALTTPVTPYGNVGVSANNDDDDDGTANVSPAPSEMGFASDGRSHHSRPIVHSLS